MTDAFDHKMREIAASSASNGGPTIKDVLEALAASHEDSERRLQVMHDALRTHLEEHIDRIDERLAAMPASIKAEICAEYLAKYQTHLETHHAASPRRSSDPGGQDWRGDRVASEPLSREMDRQHWLMWLVGSKAGTLAVAVLTATLIICVNLLIYGRP